MTELEMTELFAAMLLAWPHAETFKGGIEKLGPTIKLWTSCTTDIDFWTGEQAVIRLCQRCKFSPTIADFREQAEAVHAMIQSQVDKTVQDIRSTWMICKSTEDFYRKFPAGSFNRRVIDTMGGPAALFIKIRSGGKTVYKWNLQGIKQACYAVLRGQAELGSEKFPALNKKNSKKERQ